MGANMSDSKKKYDHLTIKEKDQLIFGKAIHPVTCGHALTIGGGRVFPEINFTLPPMKIDAHTWKEVIEHYKNIAAVICSRAVKLRLPGLVVEFEQLPPMTEHPEWGAEITKILKEALTSLYESEGIPNALRVTVVDLRDAERPPLLRKGKPWEKTRAAFVAAARAGADILSIESVGGKEVHDQALLYGDLKGIVVSLGSLATRDMAFLWDEISAIAKEYHIISGGDTACGFSNTAMQLSGKGMIPSVLAAIDRAASAPRSLTAYEHGATGPSKDCAYEGPILKAITGIPISMEGKSSSCAHFSPLGNIAGAAADLWSNESVQNIQLLSGTAPEAYLELLAYDCRLFNTAIKAGESLTLRNWLVESDVERSVEALMLEPDAVIKIAGAIVAQSSGYSRTKAAVETASDLINQHTSSGRIILSDVENKWLKKIRVEIESLPKHEAEAIEDVAGMYNGMFLKEAYGL
jgi:methanol--5-hydroxybenzimidazolylcobamide Co-methyltransferase